MKRKLLSDRDIRCSPQQLIRRYEEAWRKFYNEAPPVVTYKRGWYRGMREGARAVHAHELQQEIDFLWRKINERDA